ncbi:hypothetical protein DH86_00001409 [Scytalidium sp. 3C]|nr:hypothetical protein DH86_00001409 [Scytalidium sp. 3C]
MKLYRDELDTYTGPEGIQLLDTTMVLFLFNATQAAFGNWASHISDAQRLLKLSGGTEIWIGNRRVQAQVVMLLWYVQFGFETITCTDISGGTQL